MNTNKETLRLYWRHIRHHKISFFTMMIAIPLAALLLDTALPYFLAQAIGTLSHDTANLQQYLILAGIVAILGVVINFTGFQTAVRHEATIRQELVDDTFSQLIRKDHDFFANQKIGALTSKFIDFINAHIGLQDLFILRTLTFILTVGAGITIIFIHTPLLGFVVLGLIAWLLLQIRVSLKLRRPYRQERKKFIAEVNGTVADAISANLTVKTFAQEKYERKNLRQLTEKYRRSHIRDFTYLSIEGSLRLFIMASVQVVAIAIVAGLILQDQIELGIAIFVLAYLQRLAGQLFSLGELINGYDKLFLQAAPMTEILLEKDTVTDVKSAKPLKVKDGEIRLKNILYAYDGAKHRTVLDNLTLTIESGEKIGLVGYSGAGKTTITKLLLRFADIDSGSLAIDDQEVDSVTQQSLRQHIAYVPQEPILFHRSLRENIAYGKLNASDADIRRAAKQANALEFIEALPDGLDTIVGERGVKLSGGQRQRIAIARAILKDAPILILDEATSALDSESEKLIQDALEKLMKGRTSIVIAHRLSTIAKLDRIVVLDKGRVAEDGTHAELLKQKGIYAKLWSHQSGGFIEE